MTTVSPTSESWYKDLNAADREHADILWHFWREHCMNHSEEKFFALDPATLQFTDVVDVVCNLLDFAFL